MDTPRKTKLYRELAKDYTPKQADMMICKYIEGLEARIAVLEAVAAEPAAPAPEPESKRLPRKPKQEANTERVPQESPTE